MASSTRIDMHCRCFPLLPCGLSASFLFPFIHEMSEASIPSVTSLAFGYLIRTTALFPLSAAFQARPFPSLCSRHLVDSLFFFPSALSSVPRVPRSFTTQHTLHYPPLSPLPRSHPEPDSFPQAQPRADLSLYFFQALFARELRVMVLFCTATHCLTASREIPLLFSSYRRHS